MNNFNYKQMQDTTFRAELRQNPVEVLRKYGGTLSQDTQLKVLSNTKNTCYIVFPNAAMKHDDLIQLQAAGASSASTVSSVGSGGTLSTVTSTGACVSTIGTAGSAGSVGVGQTGHIPK